MYERILVPLDGSGASEKALPAAAAVARAFGSSIVLVHVVEARPPRFVHGEAHLAAVGPAAEYLERIARSLRDSGLVVETHVHEGADSATAKALAAHEEEFGHRLVVMAAHGRRGFGDLISASVPIRTASAGGAAVLLVAADPRVAADLRTGPDFAPGRMLLPLDGREEHEAALPAAVAFARAFSIGLKLVDVVPRFGSEAGGEGAALARLSPGLSGASLEYALTGAADYLGKVAKRLEAPDLHVEWSIERGRPARTLLRVADPALDLVALSTHRRMGVDASLEGCVAFGVAAKYRGNLLIVPIPK